MRETASAVARSRCPSPLKSPRTRPLVFVSAVDVDQRARLCAKGRGEGEKKNGAHHRGWTPLKHEGHGPRKSRNQTSCLFHDLSPRIQLGEEIFLPISFAKSTGNCSARRSSPRSTRYSGNPGFGSVCEKKRPPIELHGRASESPRRCHT